MDKIKATKRTSSNEYEAHVTKYQAKRCEGCPLLGQCHKSKTNWVIEANY